MPTTTWGGCIEFYLPRAVAAVQREGGSER